jgi:hypothetical protein
MSNFKSSVYHLHHDHTTHKDDIRFHLFEKFKNFNKNEWLFYLDSLQDNWGQPVKKSTLWHNKELPKNAINDEILNKMINSIDPVLTLCIVSYRRWDTLIDSLQSYLNTSVPLNLFLWLNSYKDIPEEKLHLIKELCKRFYSHDITYCNINAGTGHSRNILLSRIYRECDTPYVMTSDDDILFKKPEEILIGASILDNILYSQFGAIGIWCDPIYEAIHIYQGKIQNYKPKKGFQKVDALGAATMTIRKEILKDCNTDPNYLIGLVDWDFSMQIKKKGWLLGLLCNDNFKVKNTADKTDEIYKEARSNKIVKTQSKNLFYSKWNILPEWRKIIERGEFVE